MSDLPFADEDGTVTVTREKRHYPIPDQGMHKAVCTKAELQDSTYPDAEPGTKVLKLWWELDSTYEGDDGEPRKHLLFSRPYGLYFSPKANLTKLCNSLTGLPPQFTKKEVKKDGKTYTEESFAYKCFENMECDIAVEHVDSKDKTRTYANAASYITSAEQKKANREFLPPESVGEEAPAPKKEKVAKEEKEDAPVPKVAEQEKPVDNIIKKLKDSKNKDELENIKMLLVDDFSGTDKEKAQLEEVYKELSESLK